MPGMIPSSSENRRRLIIHLCLFCITRKKRKIQRARCLAAPLFSMSSYNGAPPSPILFCQIGFFSSSFFLLLLLDNPHLTKASNYEPYRGWEWDLPMENPKKLRNNENICFGTILKFKWVDFELCRFLYPGCYVVRPRNIWPTTTRPLSRHRVACFISQFLTTSRLFN